MGAEWERVKELEEGEFRIRKENNKCILERKISMPVNVTGECYAELHTGELTPRNSAYIRVMHRGKLIGIAPASGIESRDDRYEFHIAGPFSFAILKIR